MHRTSSSHVLNGANNNEKKSSTNIFGGNYNSNSISKMKGSVETLPKQFVASMKTLFDILDDQRTGYVKFSEIENRWQDDGSKSLPKGVVESLRKVTPTSGMLSFDRFCAGLKICLLRNQNNGATAQRISSDIPNDHKSTKPPRPPSAPLLNIDSPLPNPQWTSCNSNNTATVRPNNIMQSQRALSLPQLSPDSDLDLADSDIMVTDIYSMPKPPPKPPRSAMFVLANNNNNNHNNNNNSNNPIDKAEIRHALQNWQMGVLMNEMDAQDKRKSIGINRNIRGTADGGTTIDTKKIPSSQSPIFQKKTINVKRREPRRHTLQNGIDYNMIKRLKQFEEERDVLLEGLNAVETAKEWYLQQLSHIQEKIKYLGRMGSHVEQWSEVHQERLNFQRARVFEINRHLATLADTWERGGLPIHMNLAIRHGSQGLLQPVESLKQQNRHLTEQVSKKTERITTLEREKQTLIRELVQLQPRSNHHVGAVNSSLANQSTCVLGNSDVVY